MRLFGERYLGGKVNFTSREFAGTTFTLTLPKVHASTDSADPHDTPVDHSDRRPYQPDHRQDGRLRDPLSARRGVGLLDRSQQGRTSGELLGVGRVPVVGGAGRCAVRQHAADRDRQPRRQNPAAVAEHDLEAIQRGLDVVSGLHDFLADDPEFARAAAARGVKLVTSARTVSATWPGAGAPRGVPAGADRGPRLQLRQDGRGRRGDQRPAAPRLDAKFGATGQTGIIVEGDGYPIDCMVADFVSGPPNNWSWTISSTRCC